MSLGERLTFSPLMNEMGSYFGKSSFFTAFLSDVPLENKGPMPVSGLSFHIVKTAALHLQVFFSFFQTFRLFHHLDQRAVITPFIKTSAAIIMHLN